MEYQVDSLMYAAGKRFWNTIRTGITLDEPIDVDIYRKAVDRLPLRFPYFAVRLARKGDSLIYESNDAPFVIAENGEAVTLNSDESNYHLLAFSYKDSTMFIDSSHFLMDGGGKFQMLKMLLYEYLSVKYPDNDFILDEIPQPGDDISDAELTDSPYPDKELNADFPILNKKKDEIFKLPDQPTGYSKRKNWTSFKMKIKQSDLMAYASQNDGSPATFISSIVYRAIADLHPETDLPIVCGMQHQFRKALGNPMSHSSHVRIVQIAYPDQMRERDIELLNTMGRGTLLAHASTDQDKHDINRYIRIKKRFENMNYDMKRKMMRRIVKLAIGKNTFEVSYTGRVGWSGMDKHLTCFTPYIDMNLSGGLSVEIFSLGEYFDINIMQRTYDRKYVDRIVELLAELGINCEMNEPEPFSISRFQLLL